MIALFNWLVWVDYSLLDFVMEEIFHEKESCMLDAFSFINK